MNKQIAVAGAGTWGIALARLLARLGNEVTVWSHNPAHLRALALSRRHPHLPDMELPENLRFTDDMAELCRDKALLLFAVPSVAVRETAALAAPHIQNEMLLVDAAKGIESQTLLPMTAVIAEEMDKAGKRALVRLAALSGPTHAEEVSKDMPSAIVAASADAATAEAVRQTFSSPALRVYTSCDLRGVELCGALKNIIALAAGISNGLGHGDNTKAALVTRGLAEIARLGLAMGCETETFMGLAGVGDLIVTATSPHSRNNRAGFLIGQGRSAEEACRELGMVVEGLNALDAAMTLSEKYGVEMPITFAVNAIVNEGKDAQQAVDELMLRGT